MSFDFSLYEPEAYTTKKAPQKKTLPSEKKTAEKFDFSLYEPESIKEESLGKTLVRRAAQPVIGAASMTPYGLATSAMQAAGVGEALSELGELEERLPELRQKFPWANLPEQIDREKYLQATQEASNAFPTVENIAGGVGKAIGIPLEAQDTFDRLLRVAGGGARLFTGNVAERLAKGAVAGATAGGLEQMGVPETIAELGGYGLGEAAGSIPKMISRDIVRKPSGMIERRFEKLEKPTKISHGAYGKIKSDINTEVRSLSDKIITDNSSIARDMAKDPQFAEKVNANLDKVKELARGIDEKINPEAIQHRLSNKLEAKKKGFIKFEEEEEYQKELNRIINNFDVGKFHSLEDVVEQYRATNQALKKYFQPGGSKAVNNAKRDALLAVNDAILEQFEHQFPESEFTNFFKKTNEQFHGMKNVETMREFVDDITKEGFNFKKAGKLFEDRKLADTFKKGLGEDGYNSFKQLITDFHSLEPKLKNLKPEDALKLKDFVTMTGVSHFFPKLALPVAAYKGAKSIYSYALTRPRYITKMNKAIDLVKHGKYAEANAIAKGIEQEAKNIEPKVAEVEKPALSKEKDLLTKPNPQNISKEKALTVTPPKQKREITPYRPPTQSETKKTTSIQSVKPENEIAAHQPKKKEKSFVGISVEQAEKQIKADKLSEKDVLDKHFGKGFYEKEFSKMGENAQSDFLEKHEDLFSEADLEKIYGYDSKSNFATEELEEWAKVRKKIEMADTEKELVDIIKSQLFSKDPLSISEKKLIGDMIISKGMSKEKFAQEIRKHLIKTYRDPEEAIFMMEGFFGKYSKQPHQHLLQSQKK